MRRLQLSWENEECKMQNVKYKKRRAFFNGSLVCGKIEKKVRSAIQ
jgi:hypothetical protein